MPETSSPSCKDLYPCPYLLGIVPDWTLVFLRLQRAGCE